MLSPVEIQRKLDRLLPLVTKPGRYTGGELNSVAVVFPDIYDLGMSNLGTAILYDTINQRLDALAERAYAPLTDMESVMREQHIPLFSLETSHPRH